MKESQLNAIYYAKQEKKYQKYLTQFEKLGKSQEFEQFSKNNGRKYGNKEYYYFAKKHNLQTF